MYVFCETGCVFIVGGTESEKSGIPLLLLSLVSVIWTIYEVKSAHEVVNKPSESINGPE